MLSGGSKLATNLYDRFVPGKGIHQVPMDHHNKVSRILNVLHIVDKATGRSIGKMLKGATGKEWKLELDLGSTTALVAGPYTIGGIGTGELSITAGWRVIHHLSVDATAEIATTVDVSAMGTGSFWLYRTYTYVDGTWSDWLLGASPVEVTTKRTFRRAYFTVADGVVTDILQTTFGLLETYRMRRGCD